MSDKKGVIRIDGDVLVYRTGFGYKNFGLLENVEGYELEVKKIRDKFPDYKPELVISNSAKTFRHQVAVTLPYKGTRKPEDKPKFYSELRDFAVEELGAVVSPAGYEADDYIGANTNPKKDIIATIDKDLFMIPAAGHYNFVRDELVEIQRPEFYFWRQMLIGDKADNIAGLWKIGEARADEILADRPVKEMRGIVEFLYFAQFGEPCWKKRFDENGRLLWIKRDYEKEYFDYV